MKNTQDTLKKKNKHKLEGWLCPRCGCGNSPFVLSCQDKCHIHYQIIPSGTLGTSSGLNLYIPPTQKAKFK